MERKKRQHQIFAAAATFIVVAAILYCSWPLGFVLNPVAMRSGLASELGALGQPYNWLFIGGDVVSGILLVAGVALLLCTYRRQLPRIAQITLLLLAVYGICGALDAALPMDCLPSEQACGSVFRDPVLVVHGLFDFAGAIALIATLVLMAVFVHKRAAVWRPWIYTVGIGGTIFAVMSGVVAIWGGPGEWAQRYYITLSCMWVASVPFIVRPRTGPKRVRSSA